MHSIVLKQFDSREYRFGKTGNRKTGEGYWHTSMLTNTLRKACHLTGCPGHEDAFPSQLAHGGICCTKPCRISNMLADPHYSK